MKLNDPLFASDDYPRAVILELEPLGTNTLATEEAETTPDGGQDSGSGTDSGDASEDTTTRLLDDENTDSSDSVPHPTGYYERIQFIYRESDLINNDYVDRIAGSKRLLVDGKFKYMRSVDDIPAVTDLTADIPSDIIQVEQNLSSVIPKAIGWYPYYDDETDWHLPINAQDVDRGYADFWAQMTLKGKVAESYWEQHRVEDYTISLLVLNTESYDEDLVKDGNDQPSMYNKWEVGSYSIDFTNAINAIDNAVGSFARSACLLAALLSLSSLF